MRFLHACMALALAVAVASAAPPVVPPVIEGKAGKPLLFDVKLDGKAKVGWARGFDKNKCVVVRLHSDDPTVMSFMAIPDRDGEYYLTFWTEGEITSSQTVLKVGKAPDDDDVDPPTPSNTGLKEASAAGLANVKDKSRAADLAKAQRAHASAVAAGAFSSPAAILAGWRAANNRLEPDLTQLPAFQTNWLPWGEAVSKQLASLHSAGKLPDNAAWAAAFNEVADGLEGK